MPSCQIALALFVEYLKLEAFLAVWIALVWSVWQLLCWAPGRRDRFGGWAGFSGAGGPAEERAGAPEQIRVPLSILLYISSGTISPFPRDLSGQDDCIRKSSAR